MTETDPNSVPPETAQSLTVIVGAMAGGLTLMAGLVVWAYAHAADKVPTPDQIRTVNLLTGAVMVPAATGIVASELLWRRLLRSTNGSLAARVQTAFIARMALREGAGLFGLTAAYIAAVNGTLRVYPAYWIGLAPYALFLVFAAMHWPSAARLTAEAREVLGPDVSFAPSDP